MSMESLHLPDADLRLQRDWLSPVDAQSLFETLQATLPWAVHRVRLFGRDLASPRLSCWIGDPGASYAYSGHRHAPHPWPDVLMPVRLRLRDQLGIDFNSVLANLYRDGRDGMGAHRDNEPELGPQPVIASLSLGATRRFVLKSCRDPASKLSLPLPHGSLLVMGGGTQQHYTHALPKTTAQVGPRINLTFRRVVTASQVASS